MKTTREKNKNMIRIKPNTQKFINKLAINRESMEAERIVTAETKFAKRYGVCYNTVCKYMGYSNQKKLPRGQGVKVLDPIAVNKMRLTMSDTDIIAELKTSQGNLNIQCGTRSENGIGKVSRKRLVFRKEQEETFKEGLKTDRWETPEISDYEKSWKVGAVEIGTNPIATLYTKLK